MTKASAYFFAFSISLMTFVVLSSLANSLNFTKEIYGIWRPVVTGVAAGGVFLLSNIILERKIK